nr:RNA-dependent RNA polymerase [Erysiphe necator associated negative-stranded RNA virus 21]
MSSAQVAPRNEADFLSPVGSILHQLIPGGTQKTTVPSFTTLSPHQSIPVFYLDSSATERQRKAVMLCMTLCGRCTDDRPTSWQSWVLSWSALCFPELIQQYQANTAAVDYKYEKFSPAFVENCVSAIAAQMDEDTAGDQFVAFPSGLPNAALVPVTIELAEALDLEALYAYYAMVVFIMGKSITQDNISAITTRRPDALIRKRSLQQYAYILTGAGQIHPDHFKHIQSGWIRSTQLRIVTVKLLARMNASPGRSEILDVVCVNMEMLKNSGQSYLFYIHELLTACPWAIELPSLRSPYYHYCIMVLELVSAEEYLRPYYKLMMQDASKTIRRRDIEPLIAVATFFAAQTRTTMNQYRIDQGTLPTVIAFRTAALKRGYEFGEIQNQLTTDTAAV